MNTRRSWFRPARAVPPEAFFLALVIGLALGLWLAVAPPRPLAPASITTITTITTIAPPCADARQPCRGRV